MSSLDVECYLLCLCVCVCAHLRIVNILLAYLWKISYLTEPFVNNINFDFCIVCFQHRENS